MPRERLPNRRPSVIRKQAIVDGEPMSELNSKQARFVAEYLLDLSATGAAKRAGYSEKTAHSSGPRLLVLAVSADGAVWHALLMGRTRSDGTSMHIGQRRAGAQSS